MKKATLIVAAGAFVCLSTAEIVTAQRTPVAGFSPNFVAYQPATSAILAPDANRLIRWQGWLDVDAFSTSVLNQIQKQLGCSIEVGQFTIIEPSIANTVRNAKASDPFFIMNENLSPDRGEDIVDVKLHVWTYRHNFVGAGLYQLYISAQAKMLIGKGFAPVAEQIQHHDIQSLAYEFGDDCSNACRMTDIIADIEIWRGVVVRVNARGEIVTVGNEGCVLADITNQTVGQTPMSNWERAPSLRNNANYNPRNATGTMFVAPLERPISIQENSTQKATGDVQADGSIRTILPFRYRVGFDK